MTTLTGHELEVLIGLRTTWGTLYSKELARLLAEDNTIRAITHVALDGPESDKAEALPCCTIPKTDEPVLSL